MKKSNDEYIGFYESVTAVIKDYTESTTKAVTIENNYEWEECIKFGDVLTACIENGYKNGTIHLILESYLDGKIYRYGNYSKDDEWHEVGNMIGFA